MFLRQSKRAVIAGAFAVVASILSGAGASTRAADILDQVPSNAGICVVVNNLAAVDHKIKVLIGQLNLPLTSDPLAMMERSVGIGQGLNEHGSAAVVILPPVQGRPHPMVVLFPIAHLHAAFAADTISKPDAHGIYTISAPDGQPGYVARHGPFVVVAQHRSVLQAYVTSTAWGIKGVTPAEANSINTSDFAYYLNLPAVRKQALAKLNQLKSMMMAKMRAQASSPQAAAMTSLVLEMEFYAFRQIIRESQAASFTGNILPTGVALKVALDAVPGSELAILIAHQPHLSGKPLMGLPGGRFLAVGAMRTNGKALSVWLDKLEAKAAQDPAINKVPGLAKARQQLATQLAAMAAAGRSVRAYDLMPPRGPKGALMHGVFVQRTTGNAAAALAANMAGVQHASMTFPGRAVAVKLQPNAFVLDGVNFDRLTMHVSVPNNPALPASPMVQSVIKAIYGLHGTKIDAGAVDKTHVVGGLNASRGELANAVTAVRMRRDVLDSQPEIAAQAAHVLPHPLMVAYLPVDSWLKLAMDRMSSANGAAPPAQAGAAPANPVTLSLGTTGSQVAGQLFFPTDQLTALASDGRALMMMVMMSMMNGQQPPPPPPGQPGN